MICTGDVNGCGPRAQIHRRKDDERNWRGREDQRWMTRHRDLVGVRVAAETASEKFKAICQRSNARHGGYFQRGRRGFGRRDNGGGYSASASHNGSEKNSRSQRSDEQSSTRGIGCEFVSVGKIDGYAGRQPPAYIEYGQRRALAGNDLSRKQEDSGAGCRGRLLLWPRKRTKLCGSSEDSQ